MNREGQAGGSQGAALPRYGAPLQLDSTTLHVCNALMNGTYGVMFLGVWTGRRNERHFLFWAVSLLLTSACVLGFAALPRSIPGLSTLLFSGLVSGVSLLTMGMRSFDGRRAFKPALLILPLVSVPIKFLSSMALSPALDATLAFAILTAAMVSAALYTLRHGEDRGSLARRACGLGLLAYVPIYLLSIAGAFLGEGGRAEIVLVGDQILTNVVVVSLFAITLKRSRRVLEDRALRDGLTGALNRSGLEQHLRDEGARPRMVLAADLDHFKSINDRFGHAAGDEMLRRFARLAQRLLGPGDRLARTGGEEFVLILDGARSERAALLAEDLRRLFAEEVVLWHDRPIRATVSIGASEFAPGMSFPEALEAADGALYRAKEGGRNRVVQADANLFPVFA